MQNTTWRLKGRALRQGDGLSVCRNVRACRMHDPWREGACAIGGRGHGERQPREKTLNAVKPHAPSCMSYWPWFQISRLFLSSCFHCHAHSASVLNHAQHAPITVLVGMGPFRADLVSRWIKVRSPPPLGRAEDPDLPSALFALAFYLKAVPVFVDLINSSAVHCSQHKTTRKRNKTLIIPRPPTCVPHSSSPHLLSPSWRLPSQRLTSKHPHKSSEV